jgi:flagellin
MNFGRNSSGINIVLDQFKIPELALGFNTVGDSIYGSIDISAGANTAGTAYATLTTAPQKIAAQTVVDTKPYDTAKQSAVAVDGAIFYEHLTAAGQLALAGTAVAAPNGVSAQSLAKTAASAAVAIDGTAVSGTAVAASSAVSATSGAVIAASATVTIGGTLASAGGVVTLAAARQVTIVSSAGSETAKFTVAGLDQNGAALTEQITSSTTANATATGSSFFSRIDSVTNDAGASVGNITVGLGTLTPAAAGAVSLTEARQVTITSDAANETAKFTVVGTDQNGKALTEVITADTTANTAATSTGFFKTIASVTNHDVASVGKIKVGLGTLTAPVPVEMVGSDISSGSAKAAASLLSLKTVVDNMNISAGTLYNKVSNTMSHMGSLNAGYQLDVASKMDVDFAGETALLAKGQILAQAGTAMLAQANAQQQSVLALLQS